MKAGGEVEGKKRDGRSAQQIMDTGAKAFTLPDAPFVLSHLHTFCKMPRANTVHFLLGFPHLLYHFNTLLHHFLHLLLYFLQHLPTQPNHYKLPKYLPRIPKILPNR